MAFLWTSALVVLAAVPQGQGPAFVTAVEVRLVNVEVTVTERGGEPVRDLLPEDFEVLEDGKKVAVTNFFKVVDAKPQLEIGATPGFTPDDERFRRRVLLVVDNNFLDPPTRARVLEKTKEFVAAKMQGDAEWAVAAVGERLQYLLPFTREPYQLTAALDEVAQLPTYSNRHQLDFPLQNDPIRSQYLQSEEPSRTNRYDIGFAQRFASRERSRRNLHSFAVTAQLLGRLMRSYATFGGKKAVVLITGPMEFHPESQYLVSGDPKTWADTGLTDRAQSDPALEGLKRDLEAVLDGLVRVANSTGFQIYTLQAHGLTNPLRLHDVENRQLGMVKNVGTFTAPPEVSDPDTAPLTLAQGTGGLALRSNRPEEALSRIWTETATYYSLGYQPPHPPDGQYHRIAVKVKRPGVTVRHRLGYLDLSPEEKLAEELATPLTFPKPKGTLPVNLTVEERAIEGGVVQLTATVTSPLGQVAFLPHPQGGLSGKLVVFLAIYGENGDNVGLSQQPYPLQVPPGQEEAIRGGVFRATLHFSLPPGAYTVTATVHDVVARQHGTELRQVLVGRASQPYMQ